MYKDKLTIRHENSYWYGTLHQIVKWAKEDCYNSYMRNRQLAAQKFLVDMGLSAIL